MAAVHLLSPNTCTLKVFRTVRFPVNLPPHDDPLALPLAAVLEIVLARLSRTTSICRLRPDQSWLDGLRRVPYSSGREAIVFRAREATGSVYWR
jgi:hypothetical protein